jgi:isopropylmalate/homocitrate/citramalate synthase
MKGKVYLIDVTNRDGVQTSRILLPKLSKTMLNLYLDEMGIYQSEVGFPTLKHEVNYINANLELVKLGAIKRIHLEGWCRAIPEDVSLSFKNCSELKHINVSMSTSEIMIQGKFQGKKTFKDIIKSLVESVKIAKELGAETIGVNAEDASRTELDRICYCR